MSYLILYLAVTVVGYLIGRKVKISGVRLPWVSPMQTAVIVVLVFLMGSRIGANREIVSSLHSIGLISLAYTLIILAATVVGYSIARRLLGFDRYGIRTGAGKGRSRVRRGSGGEDAPEDGSPGQGSREGGGKVNGLTILIVAFVALGIACGYLFLPRGFIAWTGRLLTISLCILLVLIGIDIGREGTLARNFRSAGWRVIAFPFVSILSMAGGSVIAGLILPLGIQDSLCVGSGFAWYSLAPVMLADYSTRVSAISFMHNVFREILGILLVPMVARRVGYIECYGLPGSTSMDVCLPVIERATSADVAVYSFINGAIISASVPVLVTFFMSL